MVDVDPGLFTDDDADGPAEGAPPPPKQLISSPDLMVLLL